MKAEKKCKYIGITGYNLRVLKAIVEKTPEGSIDVVLSYCRLTLFNQGEVLLL